jgi:hypothetical protein
MAGNSHRELAWIPLLAIGIDGKVQPRKFAPQTSLSEQRRAGRDRLARIR